MDSHTGPVKSQFLLLPKPANAFAVMDGSHEKVIPSRRASRVGNEFQCDWLPDVLTDHERKVQEDDYTHTRPECVYRPSQYDIMQRYYSTPYSYSIEHSSTTEPEPEPEIIEDQQKQLLYYGEGLESVEHNLSICLGAWLDKCKLYQLFYSFRYNPEKTHQWALSNPHSVSFASPGVWTDLERNLFESTFRAVGKDWLQIMFTIKSRTLEEVIVYYYAWKASTRGRNFIARMTAKLETKKKSDRRLLAAGLPICKVKCNFTWDRYGIPCATDEEIYLQRSYPSAPVVENRPLLRKSRRTRPAGFYCEEFDDWYG